MFWAAKLLPFLTQPLAWVAALLLLVVCLLTSRPRLARSLCASALALLLCLGWEPWPDLVLRHLEQQYPLASASQDWSDYAGVIVLGGALEPAYVWSAPGQSALNGAAERMLEAVLLLRQQPQLKLLFSGGEDDLLGSDVSEAARASQFFQPWGLDLSSGRLLLESLSSGRLLLESASRNTYENAVLSRRLAGVDPSRRWLLLTSAWHMPRAMAAFSHAGWNVTAYPVDFRSGQQTPWTQYSMRRGSAKWRLALHELLGLLAYRLTGRA